MIPGRPPVLVCRKCGERVPANQTQFHRCARAWMGQSTTDPAREKARPRTVA